LSVPSDEQGQWAKWDLLLLDLERRAEQLRQLKTVEPWRLAILAAAALFAAGGVVERRSPSPGRTAETSRRPRGAAGSPSSIAGRAACK
jgi:hypothetical protein